jgi:uncharacterized membrane protein YfcA
VSVGSYLEVSLISFLVSFVFGLGGLGSAVALIPILVFLGIPFPLARSAGLFTNVLSTSSATFHNLKKGLVDIRFAFPIVVASMLFSPLGAYFSHFVPEKLVGLAFTLFLFFAGVMVYIPKKGGDREGISFVFPLFVGSFAGFVSGFLGVGGGGLISPLLIVAGLNPKKVSTVTAFAVSFSSFVGFLTYWKMGSVDWGITLFSGIPAAVSGYLAAYVGHAYLKPKQVKKILGAIFFLLGIKFLFKFL